MSKRESSLPLVLRRFVQKYNSGEQVAPADPKQENLKFFGSFRGAQIPERANYLEYYKNGETKILDGDIEICREQKLGFSEWPDWLQWYYDKKKEYGL